MSAHELQAPLLGAGGTSRSDWPRAREGYWSAIDSTRARTNGGLVINLDWPVERKKVIVFHFFQFCTFWICMHCRAT